MNIPQDYIHEYDTTKLPQAHGGKMNGFGGSTSYRASFTSYPNSNRNHQLNSSQFRDAPHTFYPPGNDAFSSQTTSPLQNFDPHGGFEYLPQQHQGLNGHKGFLDGYNPNGVPLLSHHNNPKSNGPIGSQPYPKHSYPGGPVQLTSQTPYGPHVAAGGNLPNTLAGSQPNSNANGVQNGNNTQEEISTIFVVGFPEDMQEREFQNMFTFSPGFEAATLKIPNKEYTSYGARGYQGYNGSNDPYNLVTVNQGGVVVDGGRDGTTSSWPAAQGDDGTNTHFQANGNRKQIIGFAKFKSREHALEARDVLQGRRVDIEKGAVLKAEMAKKNLHTKRGVGPVAGPAIPTGPQVPNLQQMGRMNNMSMSHHVSEFAIGPNDPYSRPDAIDLARPGTWRDQLQRDVHAVTNGIGSANTAEFHPRKDREEEERKKERESGFYSAMGFPNAIGQGPTTRGPRERAEDEERRRKDQDRLRSSNSNAFDAFHSVPPINAPPPLSRQNSGINLLPPPMESGSGMGSSPLLASAFTSTPNVNHQSTFPSQHDDLSIGPWDNVHTGSASRSSSQRSISPDDEHFSPAGDSIFEGHRAQSESSASSLGGSQGPGVIGGPASHGGDNEIDLTKVMNDLALNTDNGTTSPQLPSPASGASSASTRNAIDQNPPINTLYVGNLPTSPPPLGMGQDYLEESLRQLFSQQPGFKRLCFRQKSNGPMCFVEFEDIPHASKALNELYGNTLNGLVKHGGIRLSYSKNPLGVRTPTTASSPNGSLSHQQALQAMVFPQDQFRGDELAQPAPSNVMRREGGAGNYGNSFMTSPPPRFTSPPASHFGQQSLGNTPNGFGRANGGSLNGLFSYNLSAASGLGGSNAASTVFSPFSMTNTPTIPEQSSPDDSSALHSSHFHRALSPPVNNVEATRAG